MPLQYLKDDYNIITAVVVPIKDWEKITEVHKDINLILGSKQNFTTHIKPSDFRGCISAKTADKLNIHIEKSRSEWNINI